MADIHLINLCQGFRLARTMDVGEPLVVDTLEGGASLGCFPVVTHRKIAGTNAIASRIDRKNGRYDRLLLAIGDGPDTEDDAFPGHTPLVAAVAATPLTGTLASPYPVPTPPLDFGILYRVGGFPVHYHSWDPDEAPPDPLTNGSARYFSAITHHDLVSFGDGPDDVWVLSPNGGTVPLVNYRTFRIYSAATYTPGGLPQALVYLQAGDAFPASPAGYYWPSIADGQVNTPLFTGASGAAQFQAHMWGVSAGVDAAIVGAQTITGGQAVFAFNGPNAVMAPRGAIYVLQEEIVMPAFGGVFTRDYNVAPARPTLIFYANAGVTDIAVNGVSGDAYAVPALPGSRSSSTVGSFLTDNPTSTVYNQAWSWDGMETETDYELTVTAFGETMVSGPFTVGFSTVTHMVEGIVHAKTI